MVDATEVGDDDRDGQSDDQHAAEGANGAKDLPGDGLWHHVSISVEGGRKEKCSNKADQNKGGHLGGYLNTQFPT